jgi:lipopolysaccharide transport system ATP-binding protein
MNNEVLIRADNVSKKFCVNLKKSLIYGGGDIIKGFFGINKSQTLRKDEFWAINNVSFEIKRGECYGLIGRNGAGKSTLLKMLNGLIRPDLGTITMVGRVGALIELGAGFNPLLSGQENVYINGSLLGLTKNEIKKKFDEIVSFAELEKFIKSPVQNYSSGMKVRLGFAIAVHMDPDILILDEVLAVGDAAFRSKCYNKIAKLKNNSATIFVSHAMQQVTQICDKVITLDKGNVKWNGDVSKGVLLYNSLNNTNNSEDDSRIIYSEYISNVKFYFNHLNLTYKQFLNFNVILLSEQKFENCLLRLFIYNTEGLIVTEWNSKRNNFNVNIVVGENNFDISVGPLCLRAGDYKLGISLNNSSDIFLLFWSYKQYDLKMLGNPSGASEYQL